MENVLTNEERVGPEARWFDEVCLIIRILRFDRHSRFDYDC